MGWNSNGRKGSSVLVILAGLFSVVGIGLLILANITGIGVLLYNWGSLDLPLGASAWTAFVIWAKMLGVGVVSIILGQVFIHVAD